MDTFGGAYQADAYIISFWNSDDVMYALHTISAKQTKNGEYELFNNDPLKEKSYIVPEVGEELSKSKNIPLSAFCISKKGK